MFRLLKPGQGNQTLPSCACFCITNRNLTDEMNNYILVYSNINLSVKQVFTTYINNYLGFLILEFIVKTIRQERGQYCLFFVKGSLLVPFITSLVGIKTKEWTLWRRSTTKLLRWLIIIIRCNMFKTHTFSFKKLSFNKMIYCTKVCVICFILHHDDKLYVIECDK